MTDALARLFASGHAADVVLAVMLAEGVWLTVRRGWAVTEMLTLLLPGALMIFALRAALTQQEWPWIAAPVMLSLPVHLLDVARRRTRKR